MLMFGTAFLIVVCGLAMFLVNPPEGYVAQERKPSKNRVDSRGSSQRTFLPA